MAGQALAAKGPEESPSWAPMADCLCARSTDTVPAFQGIRKHGWLEKRFVEKNEGPGFSPDPVDCSIFMVRPRGLEPPLRFQNQHLKPEITVSPGILTA